MPPLKEPVKNSPWASNPVTGATFTYTAEASNARKVTVQLRDQRGGNLAQRAVFHFMLSGAATGQDVVGTAPTGGIAIATEGKILSAMVAGKLLLAQTDAAGLFSVTVTDSGAVTFYPVAILPDGTMAVGAALAFA